MATRQATTKDGQKKGAARKATSKQGAAKLRANAQAASAPAPEPLMTGGTARDITGVVLAVVAVGSFIAVIAPTSAPVSAAVARFYHLGFGLGGYVVPLALLLVAALIFVRSEGVFKPKPTIGAICIFVAVISLIALVGLPDTMVLGVTVDDFELASTGGYVGFAVASVLAGALGKPIAGVVLVGLAVAGAVLIGFSISTCVETVRERVDELRARHHVEVNDRPWGDEDAYAAAPAPARAGRGGAAQTRQQQLFDADGTAETTYIGDRGKTTLITDEPDDPDEDPFVDLSDQLAAEEAKTRLIPIKDKIAKTIRRGVGTADEADEPQDLGDSADPLAIAGMQDILESNDADEDQPPFDLADSADAADSVDHTIAHGVATVVDADGTPQPIPDFLLSSPAANATDQPASPVVPAHGTPAAAAAANAVDAEGEDAEQRKLPPLSMLRHNPHSASAASSDKELRQTAESLQSTLKEFNLHSQVVGLISGPTVTTFKVQPGEGERVSRISSLEDDIALSLAAQSVRIFAPIPGTSLVGIEIPNRKRQNVNLGDVLPYVQGGPLELAIGRDAEGAPVVADLAKMPHLLIAGTTGSGKSVMINSIVMALLMRTFPEDVRLIMVDPKRVELAGYNGLPHLYVPVVTEPKQAASALQWAVSEMERRLKVFERVGVRKISTFNEKQAAGAFDHYDNPPQKMPYLVIIIDELSDLMMVAGKDVEASIVRIAQLGRAAGIHLIVATQRPSSNVVTGLIKANITNRIAFNVATGIDSRVIIDQVGAEKLTGYGDMLFSKVDWGKPKRIQGCFVSDEEIATVTDFVKSQGEADYHEEILSAVTPAPLAGGGSGGSAHSDDDPLMWEAAHIVVESQLGSTSGLQRRLKVGYARAGRIMDMLEEKGVVGPPDGSKPREVLLDEEGLAELEAIESRMSDDDGLGGY